MLPKKFRLTVSGFNRIPQKSKDFYSSHLNIKVKEIKENIYPRFVFVVPKHLDKRSSYRHLVKRTAEEIIRIYLTNIKNTANILVRVQKKIKKEDFTFLDKEILYLLSQAKLT